MKLVNRDIVGKVSQCVTVSAENTIHVGALETKNDNVTNASEAAHEKNAMLSPDNLSR
jgi:hypothetical protein